MENKTCFFLRATVTGAITQRPNICCLVVQLQNIIVDILVLTTKIPI